MKRCVFCGCKINDYYIYCKECYKVSTLIDSEIYKLDVNDVVVLAKNSINTLLIDELFDRLIDTKMILNACASRLNFEYTKESREIYLLSKVFFENIHNEDFDKWDTLDLLLKRIEEYSASNKDNYKFYDENKKYYAKKSLVTSTELDFYNFVKDRLKKKYTIIPQADLQTIVSTNTYTRNDELFRNVDFCIFKTKRMEPLVVIELNDEGHYTDEYRIKRDESVKKILNDCKIPLITYNYKDLKMEEKILKDIYNTIKHNKRDSYDF